MKAQIILVVLFTALTGVAIGEDNEARKAKLLQFSADWDKARANRVETQETEAEKAEAANDKAFREVELKMNPKHTETKTSCEPVTLWDEFGRSFQWTGIVSDWRGRKVIYRDSAIVFVTFTKPVPIKPVATAAPVYAPPRPWNPLFAPAQKVEITIVQPQTTPPVKRVPIYSRPYRPYHYR